MHQVNRGESASADLPQRLEELVEPQLVETAREVLLPSGQLLGVRVAQFETFVAAVKLDGVDIVEAPPFLRAFLPKQLELELEVEWNLEK